MELYKYINSNRIEKFNADFIVLNERIKTNPTEADIKAIGYKAVVEDAMPEYDEQTQYVEAYYTDGDTITKKYRVVAIPDEVFEDDIPTE